VDAQHWTYFQHQDTISRAKISGLVLAEGSSEGDGNSIGGLIIQQLITILEIGSWCEEEAKLSPAGSRTGGFCVSIQMYSVNVTRVCVSTRRNVALKKSLKRRMTTQD
jgi:hypothetical protein